MPRTQSNNTVGSDKKPSERDVIKACVAGVDAIASAEKASIEGAVSPTTVKEKSEEVRGLIKAGIRTMEDIEALQKATEELLKPIPKKNDFIGRLIVALLLIFYGVAFVVGLAWRLLAPLPPPNATSLASWSQINEALVMMFAGGVGATVYSVRAYLIHACTEKDFQNLYFPWYVFRSLQGVLLAFLFYFVLRGGFILLAVSEAPPTATQESTPAATDVSSEPATELSTSAATEESLPASTERIPLAPQNLNIWMLAASGSLIGLFSKYAIAKLREVFIVTFGGRENLENEDDSQDLE